MTQKTDARSWSTLYEYDDLNRLTRRYYSGDGGVAPVARFCYDGWGYDAPTDACISGTVTYGIGRMTGYGVAVGAGEPERYWNLTTLDPMGRITAAYHNPAYGFTLTYEYNRDGSLKSQDYPSGRTVDYTYDGAGRPLTVEDPGGTDFVKDVDYDDLGLPAAMQLGNNLREQSCFNERGQVIVRRLGASSTTGCANSGSDELRLVFDYGTMSSNNGSIYEETIEANGTSWTATQYYKYDGLNRLEMAAEGAAITGSTCPGGAAWCRAYGFNRFAHRWVSASLDTLHMATPTSSSALSASTNRLTSGTYDAAGNLTNYPFITDGGSLAYDANNDQRIFSKTGVNVATNTDAGGRRVRQAKTIGSTTVVYHWYYDDLGKLLSRQNSTIGIAQPQYPELEFFYLGTKLVAMEDHSATEVFYRTTDRLGSTRIITDSSGVVKQRQDFFPFGEQIPASASFGNRQNVLDGGVATYNAALNPPHKFTGHERDEDTQLDFFRARYYQAVLGCFVSPDPGSAGANPSSPQSWNAFSYVGNRVTAYVDPDGKAPRAASENSLTCANCDDDDDDGGDPPESNGGQGPWAPPPGVNACDDTAFVQMHPDECDACDQYPDNSNCPGSAQQPQSTAPGATPSKQGAQLLSGAAQRALEAIISNAACHALFKIDPVSILIGLFSSAFNIGPTATQIGYGGVTVYFNDIAPNPNKPNKRPKTARTGAAGNITINTWTDGTAGYWNTASTVGRADTLIHELLHSVGAGSNSGFFRWDANPMDPNADAKNQYNSWLIDQKCFGGSQNVDPPSATELAKIKR